MKKVLFRITSCILVLCMTVSLCACFGKGQTAMKIGKTKMSEQIFAYYMSCYRPYWINILGAEDTDEFWAGETNGTTVKEYLQDLTLTAIKSKLCAAYLFDEYKLTLSSQKYNEIDLIVSGLLEGVGGDDALEEDELMKELGMTLDDIKQVFIYDAKATALQDHLYGEEGIDIVTKAERDAFYNSYFYRYKQIYIMDVDFVRDENGKIEYDEDGYAKWEEISDERWDEKFELGKDILKMAESGENFDKLISTYTEEIGYEKYPYGHYICMATATKDNYFPEILENVKKLEVGGFMCFRSSYGLHIIQRLPLDEDGYDHKENEQDFADFEDLVTEEKYKKRVQEEFDKIEIDQEIIDKYPINEIPYSETWTALF